MLQASVITDKQAMNDALQEVIANSYNNKKKKKG
jgi:hypothetical protein